MSEKPTPEQAMNDLKKAVKETKEWQLFEKLCIKILSTLNKLLEDKPQK